MEWNKLICTTRLGDTDSENPSAGRSAFQRDFDRIAFSSSFRRLQDKTQVVPLAESDYVRTRLTHSLEAASVGRSLGSLVGEELTKKGMIDDKLAPDLGTIVAAGALAHDIGNPPFGHSGESAIQHWFSTSEFGQLVQTEMTDGQKQDFLRYEGNAQGFRILSRLQDPTRAGGLQITYSTLAAFTKYPLESYIQNQDQIHSGKSSKKFGFFQADTSQFEEIAEALGLERRKSGTHWWTRHPLAFLVEAADDICYRIIDFEDGYRLKRIRQCEFTEPLLQIVNEPKVKDKLGTIENPEQQVAYLRAKGINSLVLQVAEAFRQKVSGIMDGTFDEALISQIPRSSIEGLREIEKLSLTKVYSARPIVEIEAAGFEVLGGLLETFVSAIEDKARHGNSRTAKSEKLLQLLPGQFLHSPLTPNPDQYERVLQITDFVSGMTDSYAVSLFRKIRGISLPTM